MWLTGDVVSHWITAAEPAPAGGNDALLTMVGGVIIAAIGALATVLVAAINRRDSRTTPSPPPPDPAGSGDTLRGLREAIKDLAEDLVFVRERVAVHGQRLDDSDDRDDIQDHRIDALERAKDTNHPGWR